jgi:hypothetical protein
MVFIGAREACNVIINYSITDRIGSHDSSLKYPLSAQVFKNSACGKYVSAVDVTK